MEEEVHGVAKEDEEEEEGMISGEHPRRLSGRNATSCSNITTGNDVRSYRRLR